MNGIVQFLVGSRQCTAAENAAISGLGAPRQAKTFGNPGSGAVADKLQ
jgi:hypothetical protein